MLDAQEVADRVEISWLLTRYCTAIDSKRFDLLDDVFTEDAMIDYSSSAPDVRGTRAEMKQWLSEVLAFFPVTQHLVSNTEFEIDGDRAATRTMFFNPMGWQDEASELQLFFVGGYYEDKLVRTEAGWRIVERVEQASWSKGTMPAALPS